MVLWDYRTYRFHKKDWISFILMELIKIIIICYLFYDSYTGIFVILPYIYIDYKETKQVKLRQQKRELTLQFQSMMEALVSALNAGYSLEYAFGDARKDLTLLYEKNAPIFKELDVILAGMNMNIPLEKLLKDFGNRSHVEDIDNFANVVTVAKRNGGNLIRIIQKTVNSIAEKIRVEEEIQTMVAAKKLEERIMMVMPYGILLYLRLTNGAYLKVLYHNMIGFVLMTIFLLIIYLADGWAKKIMEISV